LYRERAYVISAMKDTPGQRLQWARRRKGYNRPADAAKAYGWNENTYKSHENDMRGLRQKPAARYGRALGVPAGWLLTGEGDPSVRKSPLEGRLLDTFRTLPETEQEIVALLAESLAQRLVNSDGDESRTGTGG
jgi:hypothetical protein